MVTKRSQEEFILLGQAGWSKPAIDRKVERISNSPPFANGYQGRSILRYLVEEACAGRVPQASDVASMMGRLDFGPGDPHVRTAKNRLVERMDAYYSEHARRGEPRLAIPERGYIVFANRNKNAQNRYDDPPIASILEPLEMAEVYRIATVRGSIEMLDPDLRPWLIVLASDGLYYPECRVTRRSATWEYNAGFGRMAWGETDGVVFEVLLIAADADGNYELHGSIKRRDEAFGRRLPSGAKILDTRRVVRRDNRPGGPTTDRLPPKGSKT